MKVRCINATNSKYLVAGRTYKVSKNCPEYYFLDIPFRAGGGSAWDKDRFEIIWEQCKTWGCLVRTTSESGICCTCSKTMSRYKEHEFLHTFYARKRRR